MLHTRQRFLVNLPRGSHSKHDTSGRTSGSPGWRGQYGQLLLRILLPTRTRLAVPAPSLLSSHTCPQEGQSETISVLQPRRHLPFRRACGRHGLDRLTSSSFGRLTCKIRLLRLPRSGSLKAGYAYRAGKNREKAMTNRMVVHHIVLLRKKDATDF